MSLLHRVAGWLATPVDRPPVAPDGIVPGFQLPDVPPDNTEAEYGARIDEALRRIHGALEEERAKPKGCRNVERFNLALEVWSALLPSQDSQVLREVPPVGIRYAVPVVPGRAS